MTVPKSKRGEPRGPVFSDGKGGTLTPAQWNALPQAERDRIQAVEDERLKKYQESGGHAGSL